MEHAPSDPVRPAIRPESDAETGASADLAAQLAAARERLAFYESFDSLIQDNVRRSGDLLREVAAEREAVERRLAAMRTELEQRLTEQRAVLEMIAGSLVELESNLGSLTSRVNQAVARLADPSSSTPRVVGTGATEDQKRDSLSSDVAEALELDPAIAFSAPAPEAGPVGELAASSPDPEAGRGSMPDVVAGDSDAEPAGDTVATGPRKIDLVIHGVPKAATALAIQRHLQDLAGVDVVEVREYVSGVLRFQVVATNFGPEDLMRWEGGGSLQTITAQRHVLELRLPSAEGG